ncbi:hypothetical protein D3C80_1486490 [compost metagenome]
MLLDARQALAGFGLQADHRQQVDEAFQLAQLIAVFQETHALARVLPALFGADRFQHRGGNLQDEFLAVVRIGQVDRIVRVDQQQFARDQVVLLVVTTPQAVAAQQDLHVVDGFQRRRGDAHGGAVADPAEVETGELAVVEAGLGTPFHRQADAVRTDMLVHIAGHRVGIGMLEHLAAFAQQAAFHRQGTRGSLL